MGGGLRKSKVLIIGGGIGGLVTALALKEEGFEVKVFESVKELKPLGVGINILPHCVRVLTKLGLVNQISERAVETSDLVYFNRLGQQFWAEPRGKFAGNKWPQFSVHRGTLQMLLSEATLAKIGSENLIMNHHFSHFEQNEEEVTAFFKDKTTGELIHQERGDILIGADGINSMVRQQLYPHEGPPVYSENVLYRGTTVMKGFLNETSMAMIGSLKQKMVVYPIENRDARGNQLINWVANLKEGKSSLTDRDWNREADKSKLLALYHNWRFDWLDVYAMIEQSEKVFEFPMSDRNPLEQWTFGRVTLLGDAAHPMYPIGSNGASQAIIDADVLRGYLVANTDLKEALNLYDAERRPATAKVVLQNRAKGPDEIMDLMEDAFPDGFTEDQIPHDMLEAIMDNYKKVAGFDIKTLNAMG